jgi:hypothetical protein
MANVDRAFRVIVLGGIALAAVPAGACGGTTASSKDAGAGVDAATDTGFPQEGIYYPDAFPSETAEQIDSSFPTEGPAMIIDSGTGDAGTGDASGFDGFPQETAQAADP